jgi:acyl-CoA dehydrogenase
MTTDIKVEALPSDDDLGELRGLARAIVEKGTAETLLVPSTDLPFDSPLWRTLTESGLTLLSTPEWAGGSGAGLAESAVVVSVCAAYAAPLPIAETDLLAAWLLTEAGRQVPGGPLTATAADVEVDRGPAGGVRVSATLERVPWARVTETVVVLADTPDGPAVLVLPTDRCTVTEGHNLAREPRDTLRFNTFVDTADLVPVAESARQEWLLRGALARAVQSCGALERALALAVDHASTRVQFGRPLARFQAVQHLVAQAAGEATAARAAVDFAVRTVTTQGFTGSVSALAVAVAKAQSARATATVSRATHQVHGAIGFTLDHQLRHFTLRALAWRGEFGNERFWERRIGEIVLASGADALWPLVTSAGH